MDQQKQSIQFDIQQLESELRKIDNEIKYKEDELKFVSSKIKAVGIAGGALAGTLAGLTLFATKKPKLAKDVVVKGANITGEKGHDIAASSLKILETDILLLKRERDRLEKIIITRKKELNASYK